jgi:pyruvate kinase
MIARFKIPQLIMAATADGKVKKQLELVFGVYPVNIDYQKEEGHILYVANNPCSTKLIKDEDTVLFAADFRTMTKHASSLIEIHNVRDLGELH